MAIADLLKSGSTEYQSMIDDWNLIDSVIKGSIVIDKNPSEYLERYVAETEQAYKRRIESAVFDNYYSRAIRDISGLPFSEEITIPDNYIKDDYYKSFFLNVDGRGNDLTTFFKMVFETALGFGVSCVLVDFYKVSNKLNDNYPVFKVFKPKNIKGAWGKYVGKNFVLTRLWLETSSRVVMDGEEVDIDEISEFILNEKENNVTLNTHRDSGSGFTLYAESIIDVPMIPANLFRISNIDEGVLKVYPVLYDLLKKNLLFYNKKSDHDNLLKISNFGILYALGLGSEAEINQLKELGGSSVLYSENVDAKFGYVEHSGRSLEIGESNLSKEEERMLKFAPEFQNRISTHPTATQIDSEDRKSGSYIRHLALNLDSVINNCFSIINAYRKKTDQDIDFKIFKNFNVTTEAKTKVDQLIKLRSLGDISRKTLLERLKYYQLFGRDFDAQAEIDSLSNEISESGLVTDPDLEEDEA